MGSSLVRFRGKGFWCRDWALEFWLHMLSKEIARLDSTDSWLNELGQHWYIESIKGGSGIIWVGLDDKMTSDQVRQLIELNKKTMLTVQAFGEDVPNDYLNEASLPGEGYASDVPTINYLQVGEYFDELLNETLVINPGYGPYGWTIPRFQDNE